MQTIIDIKKSIILEFEGEDDPEWDSGHQKLAQHTKISWIMCITSKNSVIITKVRIFSVAGGNHIWLSYLKKLTTRAHKQLLDYLWGEPN